MRRLTSASCGVGGAGRAGFVLDVPEVEVGAVLAGDPGQPGVSAELGSSSGIQDARARRLVVSSCSFTIASAESIGLLEVRVVACSVYGRTILTRAPRGRGRMRDAIQRFLCISSYEKGQDFMRQCAEMGVKPTC